MTMTMTTTMLLPVDRLALPTATTGTAHLVSLSLQRRLPPTQPPHQRVPHMATTGIARPVSLSLRLHLQLSQLLPLLQLPGLAALLLVLQRLLLRRRQLVLLPGLQLVLLQFSELSVLGFCRWNGLENLIGGPFSYFRTVVLRCAEVTLYKEIIHVLN
jgi:hypothetical protein